MNVGGDQFEPRLRLVTELLRSQSTMTLSTCDDAGWPQATPLFYYVDDDLELYWFSSMRSAHSKHVVREPRVAVTVFKPTEHWQEICGAQMRGDAMEVSGPKRRAITALYCERFQLGAVFGLTITRSRLFRFRPSWIRYLDNSKGLGFKFEVTLPCAASQGGPEAADTCGDPFCGCP